jgi:hypothetical protein
MDATGLQLKVFAHRRSVKKAGAITGSLICFFFVQSSDYLDPIVPTDSKFWQIRYNRYAGNFQKRPETRDRKRRRVDPSPSEIVNYPKNKSRQISNWWMNYKQ